MITNNQLVIDSLGDFFTTLNNLPQTDELWFVEWSGGINRLPAYEPAASLDCSFERVLQFMKAGVYPVDWFKRVLAIYHPTIEDAQRADLSDSMDIFALQTMKKDYISPVQRNDAILTMCNVDDFYKIEWCFHETRTPFIFSFAYKDRERTKRYVEACAELMYQHFLQHSSDRRRESTQSRIGRQRQRQDRRTTIA